MIHAMVITLCPISKPVRLYLSQPLRLPPPEPAVSLRMDSWFLGFYLANWDYASKSASSSSLHGPEILIPFSLSLSVSPASLYLCFCLCLSLQTLPTQSLHRKGVKKPSSEFSAAIATSSSDAASHPSHPLNTQLLTIRGHKPSL